jgi:oligosaccharide repeat unit polymerase
MSDLPFFCHPVYLFVIIWIVMLATLEIQVSWSTFPDRTLGLVLFLVSVTTMLLGFVLARHSAEFSDPPVRHVGFFVKTSALRKSIFALAACALALVLYNYVAFGLPPVAGFLGFDTFDYQEYGRFKQALEPIVAALFLSSLLESSRLRRWLGSALALGIMVAYVLRGPLLLALAQAVFLNSIRSRASKRKIYFWAFGALIFVLGLTDLIGNFRTSQQVFFAFMEIKPEFRDWPMALLWPISYISVPISNLCWIIHGAHFTEPTLSFLYPVLPSFWAPTNPHDSEMSDSHIIDGVHTYLASYFLDFSWFGVAAFNFSLGLLSGWLVNRERISRYLLISPVILSAMSFIFFWDFFLYLPTLGQLCILFFIQKGCLAAAREPAESLPPLLGTSPAT